MRFFSLPFLLAVLTATASSGAAQQLSTRDLGLLDTIAEVIHLIKEIIEWLLEPATPPLIHSTSSAPSATTITSSIETSLAAVTSSYIAEITSATYTSSSSSSSSPYVTISISQSSAAAPSTSPIVTSVPVQSYSQDVGSEAPVATASASSTPPESIVVTTSQAAAPPHSSSPAEAPGPASPVESGRPAQSPAPAAPVESKSPVVTASPAPSATVAAPSASPQTGNTGSSGPIEPRCYKGNEFPSKDQWASFDTLFNNNKQMLQGFNSEEEIEYIRNNIEDIAKADDINPSLLFSIMLEESRGDCHVVAGDEGKSVGILQVHGCTVTCHDVAKGQCSASKIKGMIDCGVQGTDAFQGFKGCLKENDNDVGAALRCYNSGSVPDKNDLTKGVGRSSYVSDVGNWVVGVQPPTDCGF